MKWAKISIETSQIAEDALSDLLIEIGSNGVQAENAGSGTDKIILTAYFPLDDTVGERIPKIRNMLNNMQKLNMDIGSGKISLESLDEQDWSKRWKEFFKPLPIGERILVFPSWEGTSEFPSRDILIQIDPGMAFGTGKHSTTILSLELLEKIIKGDENVADVGTGSGILAIAAVKLGAKKVLAIDIDTKVVAIAKENIQRNNVSDRIKVICGDLITAVDGKYEVIVSNIHTRAILSMMPVFKSYLNFNGYLILSGILGSEVSEVEDRLKNEKLTILETRQHEEWAAVLAKLSDSEVH